MGAAIPAVGAVNAVTIDKGLVNMTGQESGSMDLDALYGRYTIDFRNLILIPRHSYATLFRITLTPDTA